MTAILAFLFMLMPLQSTTELYEQYLTPEGQALIEQSEQLSEQIAQGEAKERESKTRILIISLIIALIPAVYIGKDIVAGKTWQSNPDGTRRAVGTALAGGLVLFALNYGILYLKHRMGDSFNTALAFLLVAALLAFALHLLKKP